MRTLAISGSSRNESSNKRLIQFIADKYPNLNITIAHYIDQLPLFVDSLSNSENEILSKWKSDLNHCDLLLISTPEYIYNIPAVIKNAFEWVTASGELHNKKVLAICFTPNEPRGEKAMKSLLWSLSALETKIIASLHLYKNELNLDDLSAKGNEDSILLIDEAVNLI